MFGLDSLFGGGGGNKSTGGGGYSFIQKPPYMGMRPYSGEEVGYGPTQMQDLASAYFPELKKRAMGDGQVGFQPAWYETRKRQGLGDLKEQYNEGRDIRSAQASGQGLRGGIPASIEQKAQEDYGDTTGDFLDKLSIADLEARRADINQAFYQQPQEVSRGAGFQADRAVFDLNEYDSTLPAIYRYANSEENAGGDAMGMLGGLGSMGGGQGGGMGGLDLNSIMGMFNQGGNKSLASAYSKNSGYGTGGTAGGTGFLSPQQLEYQNSLKSRY